ncbi:MAG: nuclear transport factor 2 family protein [Pseudomonadota bacterium]|nr:nuclear transport factor 2 family protein [Pseudomonadota bacterium]
MTMSLQQLSDRQEIQDLLVNYCYAVDRGQWAMLDQVFTADATIDYSEFVGFRGDLTQAKAFLSQGLKQFSACQHAISTSQISIEGDHAHGRTLCQNPMVLRIDGREHVMFMGLWYRDVFVRTAEGWRIQERYEERCYQHNLPAGFSASIE